MRTPFVPAEVRPFRPDLCLLGMIFLLAATGVHGNAVGQESADTATEPTVEAIPAPRHPREKTYIKRKWGIEILYLREIAAGYMLEFRYRVLDPEKAAPLFRRKTKPFLTHQRTGLTVGVPTPAKTGALRNSDMPLADHTYWMFFSNPGKTVRAGDLVDLRIGDFLVEGLVVDTE